MWQGWTDEKIEALRTRWAAGESGELIAKQIGAPSRNAVIGKAYRMGLECRATYQRKPMPKRERTHAERPRIGTVKRISSVPIDATPLPPPEVTDIAVVSHNDLQSDTCRWVCATDTPNNDAPKYCGCKQMLGKPYCENHARRAYAPYQPQKIRPYTPRQDGDQPKLRSIRRVMSMA